MLILVLLKSNFKDNKQNFGCFSTKLRDKINKFECIVKPDTFYSIRKFVSHERKRKSSGREVGNGCGRTMPLCSSVRWPFRKAVTCSTCTLGVRQDPLELGPQRNPIDGSVLVHRRIRFSRATRYFMVNFTLTGSSLFL